MRLVLSCAVLAFVSSIAVAGKPAKNAIDPSLKIVCKTEDVVGSKIPKRICMTRQQWDEMKAVAKETLEKRGLWQGEKTIPGN